MISPVSFQLDRSEFLAHGGLARCSTQEQGMWLDLLQECYCCASLNIACINYIAARKDVPVNDLLDVISELANKGVCSITAAGTILPTSADYLARDFYQRIRKPRHESHAQ